MKRHDSKHQMSLGMIAASSSDTSILFKIGSMFPGRLIVLVPADADYEAATQRIWELAMVAGRDVQLLSLCKDGTKELSLRRQLITMSALMAASRIPTEAKVEVGTNWVGAVKRNYQPGDIIVCFAERHHGFLQKPLNETLEDHLNAPVHILFSLYPESPPRFNTLSIILLWVGLISIMAGAFLLQIQIMSLPEDWTQTTLMILSVIVELWLILAWNNFLS